MIDEAWINELKTEVDSFMTFLVAHLLRLARSGTPAPPPAPTLQPLSLTSFTVPENTGPGVAVGLVAGRTPGSTLILLDDGGGRFALNSFGTGIVTGLVPTNYEAAQGYDLIVEQIHPTATNSGRQSTLHVDVVNLLDTALSDAVLDSNSVLDTAAQGSLIGTLGGLTAGVTTSLLNNAGGRIALSGDTLVVGPTDIDGQATPTLTVTVRQTHPDAPAPKDTDLIINVQHVNLSFAVTGTLDPAQFNAAYSDSLTVSGGAPPYSVSGLPPYAPAANVSGGTISFTGTPR
ncbi:cadherin repeat domain-containing protein [Sphingobium sp. DEHP117]|uniref:cadherin repeat domain-containing protein n=1 Tax=Sphingobium sp. DEHP117 TaxID=2993436 RepID=UPI0027D5AE58|nr:cadherin repeat domain-containing protein [Sphingobium sp. DEHP117]MDQ4421481.1 cadherin repeat domain-containing protein [Sphingobium sp. DEHP117]